MKNPPLEIVEATRDIEREGEGLLVIRMIVELHAC